MGPASMSLETSGVLTLEPPLLTFFLSVLVKSEFQNEQEYKIGNWINLLQLHSLSVHSLSAHFLSACSLSAHTHFLALYEYYSDIL